MIRLSGQAQQSINRYGHFPGHIHHVVQQEINNNNTYNDYTRQDLIVVVNYLKNELHTLQDEKRELNDLNNRQWYDINYYKDELWQEKQYHSETWDEVLENREKIKDLENKLYASYKYSHLFWKYVLSNSPGLTFLFESISG